MTFGLFEFQEWQGPIVSGVRNWLYTAARILNRSPVV